MANLKMFKYGFPFAFLLFFMLWAGQGAGQVSGYLLEWNGQRISFGSVSGLGETSRTTVYPNRTLTRSNTSATVSIKTLSLGKIRCSPESDLYRWFCSFNDPARQKRDVVVKLLNTNGDVMKTWRIYQASPSKMDVPPDLNAEANDVLIETLVLTYEKVEPDL